MPIRLVLTDAHPLMLTGLESLLTMEKGFKILESCASGEDALKAVHEYLPDILIMDIVLPGNCGLSVLKEIHRQSPAVSVVLYTAGINQNHAIDSVQYGVKGIVLKETAPRFLVQCLRKVSRGSLCLDLHSLTRAVEVLMSRERHLRQIQQCLTNRETQIVKMVAQGLRNKEIAETLFVSEGTVKLHIHNVFKKLNIRGRMELARYAQDAILA